MSYVRVYFLITKSLYNYPHVFILYSIFHPFLNTWVAWYHFSSDLGSAISISYISGMLAINSYSFIRISLFCLTYSNAFFFLNRECWLFFFFSISTLNMLFYCLLASTASDRSHPSFIQLFSLCNLSSGHFQYFLFFFGFQQLWPWWA